MANEVLDYTQEIGFPQAHLYGNDAGITFGSFSGEGSEPVAKDDVLQYAQANGFPNATLDSTGAGIAFNA